VIPSAAAVGPGMPGAGFRVGGVARSLVVVGIATAIGQAALVLASPVLARLYTPADFGLLAAFTAAASVLIAVGSLRFDLAIPVAADDEEAAGLLVVAIALAGMTAIGAGTLVALVGGPLAEALRVPGLAPFLWLVPVALLVGGSGQALAAWATQARAFRRLGRLRATQGLGMAGLQAGFGFAGGGALGLLLGDVLGRALGALTLVPSGLAALRAARPSVATVRAAASGHWRFARVMVLATLVSEVSLQVPFLLIPALYGLEPSGQVFLAYRLLVLPASLLSAAVSQVFFGEAAVRRADPRRLHDLARNVAVSLLVLSVPTYLLLAIAGHAVIGVVFGPQWDAAGTYARILAPPLVLWAVASPISTLLLVGGRERESLAFTIVELVLKAGSLVAGAAAGSLVLGLILLGLSSSAMYVAALWRFLRVAGVTLAELGGAGLRILALAAPGLAAVALALTQGEGWALAAALPAWASAVLLAIRVLPEPRALLAGIDD